MASNIQTDRRAMIGLIGMTAISQDQPNVPPIKKPLIKPFRLCLNMATIQGQNLPFDKQVEVAIKAGYQGIEPWIRDLEKFTQTGGSLKDMGKRCSDSGLIVESAIGFPEWLVNDNSRRAKSIETLKRDLDGLRQLGCRRLAAPPAGATKSKDITLPMAAERFSHLAKIVGDFGLVPMVEVWGFSSFLNRLGDASYIATECQQKSAILADIYHLYKGGSGFEGIGLLSGAALQVFHVNDYPASPPPAEITDAHRVYPGDGVGPLSSVFKVLASHSPDCVLSVELFNRDYWKQDALVVAKTAHEKLSRVVAQSIKN